MAPFALNTAWNKAETCGYFNMIAEFKLNSQQQWTAENAHQAGTLTRGVPMFSNIIYLLVLYSFLFLLHTKWQQMPRWSIFRLQFEIYSFVTDCVLFKSLPILLHVMITRTYSFGYPLVNIIYDCYRKRRVAVVMDREQLS